jgi:hypothetical protein
LQVRHNILDRVAVARKILQLVHAIVEAHHRCFAFRPHHRLREKNPGLPHPRQKRINARARFDQNHQRERIATQIKMRNLLL